MGNGDEEMTWIIGSNTIFGYGIILSDICVTFPNGETKDFIQKAFKVGNYIGCGFAGSVYLGFKFIQDLKKFIHLDDPKHAWDPVMVTIEWSKRLKELFKEESEDSKKNGIQFLLCGVSPTQNIKGLNVPKVTTSILRSPNFVPEIYEENGGIYSIGSGAEEYKMELKEFCGDISSHLGFGTIGPNGFGFSIHLSSWFSQRLKEKPIQGISQYIHTVVVQRGNVKVLDLERRDHLKNGEIIEYKIPHVAKNIEELEDMVSNIKGFDGINLVC